MAYDETNDGGTASGVAPKFLTQPQLATMAPRRLWNVFPGRRSKAGQAVIHSPKHPMAKRFAHEMREMHEANVADRHVAAYVSVTFNRPAMRLREWVSQILRSMATLIDGRSSFAVEMTSAQPIDDAYSTFALDVGTLTAMGALHYRALQLAGDPVVAGKSVAQHLGTYLADYLSKLGEASHRRLVEVPPMPPVTNIATKAAPAPAPAPVPSPAPSVEPSPSPSPSPSDAWVIQYYENLSPQPRFHIGISGVDRVPTNPTPHLYFAHRYDEDSAKRIAPTLQSKAGEWRAVSVAQAHAWNDAETARLRTLAMQAWDRPDDSRTTAKRAMYEQDRQAQRLRAAAGVESAMRAALSEERLTRAEDQFMRGALAAIREQPYRTSEPQPIPGLEVTEFEAAQRDTLPAEPAPMSCAAPAPYAQAAAPEEPMAQEDDRAPSECERPADTTTDTKTEEQ